MKSILQEIGSVKCPVCNGTCLLDYYGNYFKCQDCGNKYIFEYK